MAAEKLGLEVAIAGFRQFMSQMKGMDGAIGDTGKKWISLSDIASGAGKALAGVAKIGLVAIAAGATAAAAAIGGLAVGIGKLAIAAAPLEGIGTAFDIMSEKAGLALSDLQDASVGTIADFELMRMANVALTGAGEDLGEAFGTDLPKLMEIARASARATGQDVGFMFQSLVTGVKRTAPMLIDNTGLQLKLGEANQALADSLGKTVEELTGEERQIALLNATILAGQQMVDDFGGGQVTAAEKIAQFKTEIQNTKDQIGLAFLPALQAIMAPLGELASEVGPLVIAWAQEAGEWLGVNLPIAIAELQAWWEKTWPIIQAQVEKTWAVVQPVLATLWNWLQNDLPVAIAALQAWWEKTWPVIQSTVEQVWDFLEPIFETIAEWLQDEGPGALDDLESAWDEVWSVITELTNKAVTWFKANMPLIIKTIETLKAAGEDVMAFWRDHIAPGLDNVWNVIKNSVMTAMDVILNTITFVMQVITGDWAGAWETIKTTALLIWDNIKFALGEYLQATLDMLGTSMEEIKAVWVANWELLKEILATVWDNIVIAVTEKMQLVYDTIVDKIEEIKDWIYDQIQAFKDLGGDIIKGMTQGVLAAIGGLIDAVRKAVADAMRSAWDEAEADSPSRIMYDLGLALVQGLINGIQAKAGDAQAMLAGLVDVGGVLGGFGATAADRWLDPQKQLVRDLEKTIKLNQDILKQEDITQEHREIHTRYMIDAQERLVNEQRKLNQMERETLALEKQRQDLAFLQEQAKLLELIREHGLDAGAIMGGIELGIDADVGAIVQAMTAAMQAIVEQAEVELGISSPSRVFSTIGMEMMAGLQAGIASMVPVIQTQMQMAVQPLALPGRSASPVTTQNEYHYHLTAPSVMRDGGLQMEFAAMEMATR